MLLEIGSLPVDEGKHEERASTCDKWANATTQKLPWFCARDASRFTLFPLRDPELRDPAPAGRTPIWALLCPKTTPAG